MGDRSNAFTSCIGWIVLFAVIVVVASFLVAIVWGWVVRDVFAGAVAQGILPGKISWVQALKLTFLFGILGLTGKSTSKS